MDEQKYIAEQNLTQQTCLHCHNLISEIDYFCPNCGKKIKDKPLSTGIGRQIIVYLVSFFLPPFGLPFAFRYFKQHDDKARVIGYVVIVLTAVSVIINIWLIVGFVNQTTNSINDAYKQINQTNYGY